MISLAVMSAVLAASLLATGLVVAWAARKAGSPRGALRFGLLFAACALVINVAFTLVAAKLSARSPTTPLVLLLVQLLVLCSAIRVAFKLQAKKAMLPFAAWLALMIFEFLAAVFVLRPYVVEAFVLPTESMMPTIQAGDRFLCNKMLRPRRLDLVAYHSNAPEHEAWCKRLIGLPGDRLKFENGGIVVNDQSLALPACLAGKCKASVLPTGQRYREGETITLKSDEYFFVGDNAPISADSRIEGPSPASAIIGVIDVTYWPPRNMRIFR